MLKKRSAIQGLFILMTSMILSCSHEQDTAIRQETLEIQLRQNEIYKLQLGNFGTEEGAIIHLAPLHAAFNQINGTGDAEIEYIYQPMADYTGQDKVIIQSNRGTNGGGGPYSNVVRTIVLFQIIP